MSDRMPEDLPVTKYINVMVGITRSKVICSNFGNRGNKEHDVNDHDGHGDVDDQDDIDDQDNR